MFEVAEGKSFVLETEDNLSGRIRSESDLPTLENLKPYTDFTPQMHNPLAGPVFVKGVDKGDLLVVEIEDIVVADQGHSCIIPRFDPMAGQEAWPDLDLAFAKIIRHEPRPSGTTRDGRAHYNSKISWDLAPFIGAICVVPNTGTKSNPIRTVIAFMKFQKG